ncbi:MAG: DMT family transporter [Bacteroidales bacterium]|jgi:drug/metabolite transporter (DMT)-like permease|nr:DMT family transporter [Bacteroidales bacterium]
MVKKNWLFYALVTTLTWGVWGAFSEIPEKAGFPPTLTYVVWAITMFICGIAALVNIKFKLDTRIKSVALGMATGLLGAGGQLILFQALMEGPAYIIFPLISLSPILTVILSTIILHERAGIKSILGIILAFIAIFCISYSSPVEARTSGYLWLILSLLVFAFWGIQGFIMKVANNYSPEAESIFVYMVISGIILVPIALLMTNFSANIYLGFKGPYLAFMVQILNAIGALCLVYAMRYGKAMIVSPLTNALAPVLTVIISLIIYRVVPPAIQIFGIAAAIISVLLLSFEKENK